LQNLEKEDFDAAVEQLSGAITETPLEATAELAELYSLRYGTYQSQ